jgi:hypothetical protein
VRFVTEPPDFALQEHIFEGLSAAQARWRRETGARLVVLPWPPYFWYERDDLPHVERRAS